MEISSVRAMDSAAVGKRGGNQPIDPISKNIQNEISDIQRQKRELSSKEELTNEEKMNKRKEMQQEIANLNMQLRQRQAEFRKEQQRKLASGEMRTDGDNAEGADTKEVKRKSAQIRDAKENDPENKNAEVRDTENKDTQIKEAGKENIESKRTEAAGAKEDEQVEDGGISQAQMQEIVANDAAMEQVKNQGIVIARMEEGVVILKGEIRQDEARGEDVSKKQAELAKQEERLRRASEFQASSSGKAAQLGISDTETGNIIGNTNFSKEKEQNIQVSFT